MSENKKSKSQEAAERLEASRKRRAEQNQPDSGLGFGASEPKQASGDFGINPKLVFLKDAFNNTVESLTSGSISDAEAQRNLEAMVVQDEDGWEWKVSPEGTFIRRHLSRGDVFEPADPLLYADAADRGTTEVGTRVTHEEKPPVQFVASATEKIRKVKDRPKKEKAAKRIVPPSNSEPQTEEPASASRAASSGAAQEGLKPFLNVWAIITTAVVTLGLALLVAPRLFGGDAEQETVAPETTVSVVTSSVPRQELTLPVIGEGVRPDPEKDALPLIATLSNASVTDLSEVREMFPNRTPELSEQVAIVAMWSSLAEGGATFAVGNHSSVGRNVTAQIVIRLGEALFTSEISWAENRDTAEWEPSSWPTIRAR